MLRKTLSKNGRKPRSGTAGMIPSTLAYGMALALAAVATLGIVSGTKFFSVKQAPSLSNEASAASSAAPSVSPLNENSAGISQLRKNSESFRAVAKIIGPTVVNIKSTKGAAKPRTMKGQRRSRPGRPAPPEDEEGGGFRDPFFEFFERYGSPFPQQDSPQPSLGSGIIIDKSGYIVTNNHVVEDASEILVSIAEDKTDLKAKVIGTDPKTDLALLKVEPGKDLPVAEWADTDGVEVGDWAIAIGSPFDLRQTVTVGIVSAKGRSSNVLGSSDYVGDFIQTDAAINPGNSGGPLCTLEGKVMGVNTAIYSRSGGYMGIGFAIPSNLAKDIINKLRTQGKVVRGWLGVQIANLDEAASKKVGASGVRVAEVMPDSPAAKAGLEIGDVITHVDGKVLKDTNQLRQIIMALRPGQTVQLKWVKYSSQAKKTANVNIGELPAEPSLTQLERDGGGAPDKLGLVLAETKGKDGVVIQGIEMGGVAQMSGLEEGDEIISINGQPTKTLAAYQKATSSGRYFEIVIKRQGRRLFLTVTLSE